MYRDGEEAYRPSPGGDGSRTTKEGVESSSRATNKGVGGEVKGYEGCGVLPGCKERAKDDETKSAGERTGQNASKVSSLLMPARPSDRRRGNLAKKAGSSLVADSLAALDNMAADERLQLSAGGRKRRRNSSQGVVSGSSSCFDDSMSISRWSNTDLGGNREKDQGRDADSTFGALRPGGSDVSSTDVWTMLDSYVHGRAEVAKANRHVRAIEAMRRVSGGAVSFYQSLLVAEANFIWYIERAQRTTDIHPVFFGEVSSRVTNDPSYYAFSPRQTERGQALSHLGQDHQHHQHSSSCKFRFSAPASKYRGCLRPPHTRHLRNHKRLPEV